MMKIKHSKYKNTGLIFELLVKQIAADTLARKESPAVKVLKKYYTGNSSLVREFKLYELILKNKAISQSKADSILSTILEVSQKINRDTLKSQKYSLIKDIKENYNLDEFFSIKVQDYKSLAALYCLMESQTVQGIVDPQVLIDNKTTVLEHLTATQQDKEEVKDTLIEEFSKYDKDLRMLTYKILLEKFNKTYDNFTSDQKRILGNFITEGASEVKLRTLVNEELRSVISTINEIKENLEDNILKIKLEEVVKNIKLISKTKKATDKDLSNLLHYYELINELKSL